MEFELTYTEGKRKGFIRRNFTDNEFERIKLYTPWVKDQSRQSIRERVYCLLKNIKDIPKCKICGKNNKFLKSGRYSICCSTECQYKDDERVHKAKETKKERYGSSNFVNLEKRDRTNLARYGNACVFNSDEVKRKIKDVLLKKYGVETYTSSADFSEKVSIGRAKHYQARRNNEGTDYKGIVYILYFSKYDAIKIGLTSDFESRSKALNKDFGEFEILELIETDTCYRLEKRFHDELDSYRFCLGEGAGKTEFFSIECKGNLKDLLNKQYK